ncbi:MAG TPA: hypothetical protein DEP84_12305 [Chloroflexi bacterium]|nr:hypothetical protein [Chloroflexota bacterium]
MKRNPAESRSFEAHDGHRITEVLGMATTNTSRYSVAYIVAPPQSRGEARQNQFDEILIVEEGHATVVQDHVRQIVGPRDVMLLPAGTGYWLETGDETLRFWAICVPAFRPEWSQIGETPRRDWRDYQTPRGADRLRPQSVTEGQVEG